MIRTPQQENAGKRFGMRVIDWIESTSRSMEGLCLTRQEGESLNTRLRGLMLMIEAATVFDSSEEKV